MVKIRGVRLSTFVISAGMAWTLVSGLLVSPVSLSAQPQNPESKKPKMRVLSWTPPEVRRPLKSRIPDPPCVLPGVLHIAGDRANTLLSSLKSFTAREEIQYQTLNPQGASMRMVLEAGLYRQSEDSRSHVMTAEDVPVHGDEGSYDYLVFFNRTPEGLAVQDSRTSQAGHKMQAVFDQDLGLPELALMFLPGMQPDYEFKCEGTVNWNGQPAWVMQFKQRKDRPRRTVSFQSNHKAYPASLEGRAWINADSGEIEHMETNLINAVPAVNVEHWYLSIDYAPVVLGPTNTRMLLPQHVDAYCVYGDRRTIAYHSFTDFKLFLSTVTIKVDEPEAHGP